MPALILESPKAPLITPLAVITNPLEFKVRLEPNVIGPPQVLFVPVPASVCQDCVPDAATANVHVLGVAVVNANISSTPEPFRVIVLVVAGNVVDV